MTEQTSSKKIWTIPNLLTLFRFALIGVMVYFFIKNRPMAALATYLGAFATDILDGFIARTFHQVSDLGKAMDPVADKLMTITALTCLYAMGYMQPALLVVIIIKETMMVLGGILIYTTVKKVVQANLFGKISAGAYFCAIVSLFLHERVQPYDQYFMYGAVAMNIASMMQYGIINILLPLRKRKQNSQLQRAEDKPVN